MRTMQFIDIHNHLLYGIDDGIKTKEEMLTLLKDAVNGGIKKMIFTPHFKEHVFEVNKALLLERFNEVQSLIRYEEMELEVYLGTEIFLTHNTSQLLSEGRIQTLNDTSYLLVETHFVNQCITYDLDEELYNLSVDGYRVILAHPERYQFVRENTKKIEQYVESGYYMQLNVGSLFKPHLYKLAIKLLDHNLIHFIASDAHDAEFRRPELQKGYEFILKRYGQVRADDLFYNNPNHVIKGETIKLKDYEKIKRRKWFF